MLIVLFASADPLNVGLASLVMWSVFDAPVSLPAFRSGRAGVEGAVASTVILPDACVAALPTASVASTRYVYDPSATVTFASFLPFQTSLLAPDDRDAPLI